MRRFLFAASLVLSGYPAAASSIMAVPSHYGPSQSVLSVNCSGGCEEAPPAPITPLYKVPDLQGKPVARYEFREELGKRSLIHIDEFLGGSPVETVSARQVTLLEELQAADQKIAADKVAAQKAFYNAVDKRVSAMIPPDERPTAATAGIDPSATTAAVTPEPAAPAPFNPDTLQMRTN